MERFWNFGTGRERMRSLSVRARHTHANSLDMCILASRLTGADEVGQRRTGIDATTAPIRKLTQPIV